jgi:hypothetical protein
MFKDILSNVSYMSKDELELLSFRPFKLKSGLLIMLIPKRLLSFIADGTKVISVDGDNLVIGSDYIDPKSSDGYVLYGVTPCEEVNRLAIPIGDVIKHAYFEAIPWYLMRIGSAVGEVRPSAYHFTTIHSSFQGVSSRAEYMADHPLEGLSYLLLFSAISNIFHGNNRKVFEAVVDHIGYSPVEGDWGKGEKFIEDELRVRMTPDDIKKVSLGIHRKKTVQAIILI